MKNPKHILITGASSGIGQGLAEYYAGDGAYLYLTGRNVERLQAVAQACRDKGAVVEANVIDVTDADAMKEWITGFEHLDLAIANAGISGGTGGHKAGEPVAQARTIFDTNITGVLNTFEPALEKMKIQTSTPPCKAKGQIAIVSSLAGLRGYPSAPGYSASKGAVRFYGEAMRGVLKPNNIEVNVIFPGFVTSRITEANDFPMPLKMNADKAAKIIAKGLARNKGRIAFPWPMYAMAWLIGILPDGLAQKILAKAPVKMAIVKEN